MKANVYLTGFMGTGKTAVGRALARRLKRPFVDTDVWIEKRVRASVARIFETRGEPSFRRLERQAVKAAASKSGQVVALGGGALLDRRNLALAAKTGRIVRLRCDRQVLWRRLKREVHLRPLLQAPNARAHFMALLKRREAVKVPGAWRLSTTSLRPAQLAAAIAARLKKEGR